VRNIQISCIVALVLTVTIALTGAATPCAQAQTFTVLYNFTGGADGGSPNASLVLDNDGNVYGTTEIGGSGLLGCPQGCGTVFKVDPSGNETVLHNFGESVKDGANPLYGSLFRDNSGNLYGTTGFGGADNSGTIFKLSPGGKELVFSFAGGAKGGFPYASVTLARGNLYGTTHYRGTGCPPYGCGTVFKVNGAGKETVLYSFAGGTDAEFPWAGVVLDSAGDVYGTTLNGGTSNQGTVFKISSAGKETILHSFTNAADGGLPFAGLVIDGAGNLYGTTYSGGTPGGGTVFKIDSSGTPTVLYNFCSQSGCEDGEAPFAALVRDSAGNLYGTTDFGGFFGQGTVFKLDTTGKETVLRSFNGASDGGQPVAGLALDGAGNLYGTTPSFGAYGFGTVFKLTP
jgi:uncharacterized repeat protein (TIGR03803 family)